MRLADLQPSVSPPGGESQKLTFLCPRCQRHFLQIDIWNGSHCERGEGRNFMRLWHAEQGPQKDWDTFTVTPSIDRSGLDKCGGWHGHITNGEVS